MNLVNLTPHDIAIRTETGTITIPSSGQARCVPGEMTVENLDGMPCPVARYGDLGPVLGLPGPIDGVAFIVSAVVLAHPSVAGRTDVFAPGTGPADGAIRDGGRVVAVTRLVGRA
jgi:hypothetical protein